MDNVSEPMAAWQRAWRIGIAPQLSENALLALARALERDSSKLIQGSTCQPPPLQCVVDWPVEAACGLAYAGWQGEGLANVGQVEEYFYSVCSNAEKLLGEPAACAHFLNWFDDSPRLEMRLSLLAEVMRELNERTKGKKSLRCPSCGHINVGVKPSADDHVAWHRLALDHNSQCLWIKSRGGQVPPEEDIFYRAKQTLQEPPKTPLAKVLQQSIQALEADKVQELYQDGNRGGEG